MSFPVFLVVSFNSFASVFCCAFFMLLMKCRPLTPPDITEGVACVFLKRSVLRPLSYDDGDGDDDDDDDGRNAL